MPGSRHLPGFLFLPIMNKPIAILLSKQEQFFAAQAGIMRRISAMQRNRSEPHGKPANKDYWGSDIESCGAEAAVAKYFGLYWDAVASGKLSALNGDVQGLEVRSTSHPNGRLILHNTDKDESPYILVRGEIPEFQIIGWMYGKDGKQMEFWEGRTGRPAFFIPENKLRPIEELEKMIKL
jgi:hypothetical protein